MRARSARCGSAQLVLAEQEAVLVDADPGGEHSFGPDLTVRNGSGRVTGLLGGKTPTSASVLVTTFGA